MRNLIFVHPGHLAPFGLRGPEKRANTHRHLNINYCQRDHRWYVLFFGVNQQVSYYFNFINQVDLTYFPRDEGYQYSMTNCLLNAAIDKILPLCNCTPHSLPNKIGGLPFCTGKGVACFQVKLLPGYPANKSALTT